MTILDSRHMASQRAIAFPSALELSSLQGQPLRAVLTRPAERQITLAHSLSHRGWQVLSIPALELHALDALPNAMLKPEDYDWVMFVSRAAWQMYREYQPSVWPSRTGIAVVGQGTAAVIRAELAAQMHPPNLLSPHVDASQDSEGLWQVLAPRLSASSKVLIVAGLDGRSWLADRLRSSGVHTDVLPVYERRAAALSEQAVDSLLQWTASARGQHSGVWLLTSKQSIEALTVALTDAGVLNRLKPAAWVLTHARLVEPAKQLALQMGLHHDLPMVVTSPDDQAILKAFAMIARAC